MIWAELELNDKDLVRVLAWCEGNYMYLGMGCYIPDPTKFPGLGGYSPFIAFGDDSQN